MQEAEYEIIETRPLTGDGSLGCGNCRNCGCGQVDDGLGEPSFINEVTEGRTGRLFTVAANLAGLSMDADQLNRVYREYRPEIEAYFNQIDRKRLLELVGDDVRDVALTEMKATFQNSIAPGVIGFGFGLLGYYLIQKFKG